MKRKNMLPLIMRSFPSEFCHNCIFFIKEVLYKHNVFIRGDDLGELSETTWPDSYVPASGVGDLTGM